MKKILFVLAGIISTSLILSACKQTASFSIPKSGTETSEPIQYTFDVSKKDSRTKANIYFVENGTKQMLNSVENMFEGLKLEKEGDNQYFGTSDNGFDVTFMTDANIWTAINTNASNTTNESTEEVTISDSKCIEIAKNFLDNYKIRPKNYDFASVGTTTTGGFNCPEKIIKKSVYFFPSIDDKQVYGNSKIYVDINSKGDIIKICGCNRNIKPNEKQESNIISADKAIEMVKNNHPDVSANISGNEKKVTVKEAELMYYSDINMDTIQPIWSISGIAENTDETTSEYEALIPAIYK